MVHVLLVKFLLCLETEWFASLWVGLPNLNKLLTCCCACAAAEKVFQFTSLP